MIGRILGACLCLTAFAACGGSEIRPATAAEPPHDRAAAGATAAEVKRPGEAKIGDKTLCPISHEEFVVTADSPKAEYEGKTYYFCCANCAKKFQTDPKKFTSS